MKNFDEHIIKLIDMLEYDMWAVIKDEHIDCVCRNFETDQGRVGCPYCFGTGRKVKIKKIKGVRQPTSGSARDMTISYNYGVYFFKNIYDLREGDFIIWDNRIEEVSHIKEYCSDAQKPVYYRVEAIPKKADNEIFLRLFSKMVGKKYSKEEGRQGVMLENTMLLIGMCDSKYRVGEIIPSGDGCFIMDNFGSTSCFYKAVQTINRFNKAAHIYLLNLDTWHNLINMSELIAEMGFDYIVPLNLYIDEKYYDERFGKTVTYTQMLLRALSHTVSTVIMTGKEASAYETLDDFLLDEEKRIEQVKPELINVNKENLIYIANNLSGIEYSNAALAAIISSTDYSLYPSSKSLSEAVFDIDFSDVKTDMTFFRNNYLTGTTIENLVNFSDNPLYKPFTVKRILKYFYYHRPDIENYRGRPYTDYLKTKIIEEFEDFLRSLDGWIIYRHEIMSAVNVSVEPGAVDISVKYAIYPKFTIERYVLES